jgi:hypothetical protein
VWFGTGWRNGRRDPVAAGNPLCSIESSAIETADRYVDRNWRSPAAPHAILSARRALEFVSCVADRASSRLFFDGGKNS